MTAIEFLRRCSDGNFRIVSTGDMNDYQIATSRLNGWMFVDDDSALGWSLWPWNLTTHKDAARESGKEQ